ncbi:hypothetical protein ACNS7O_06010 [Haloferacaceae archaeon DSL9]
MTRNLSLWKLVGIVVLALVAVRIALWLLGVVVGIVVTAIQLAITLLFLALLVYGIYWGYRSFVADEPTARSREREKLYER